MSNENWLTKQAINNIDSYQVHTENTRKWVNFCSLGLLGIVLPFCCAIATITVYYFPQVKNAITSFIK